MKPLYNNILKTINNLQILNEKIRSHHKKKKMFLICAVKCIKATTNTNMLKALFIKGSPLHPLQLYISFMFFNANKEKCHLTNRHCLHDANSIQEVLRVSASLQWFKLVFFCLSGGHIAVHCILELFLNTLLQVIAKTMTMNLF